MKIRKMQKKDKPKVMAILKKTKVFSKKEISIAEELIDIYLNSKKQKDYLIFVSSIKNKITGYICFGPTPCTENTFDIYWLAVDPKFHGSGIGSKLLKFAERKISSQNGKIIVIETSSTRKYKNTRKFYLGKHYKVATIIKDFYKKNDHKFIFIKRIRTRRRSHGDMEKNAA